MEVGGDDFFFDRLLSPEASGLRVVEIKAGKFKPEHIGQLGFYMEAVDAQVKHDEDAATIGLLLCKTKNERRAWGIRHRAWELQQDGRAHGRTKVRITPWV